MFALEWDDDFGSIRYLSKVGKYSEWFEELSSDFGDLVFDPKSELVKLSSAVSGSVRVAVGFGLVEG